MGADWKNRLNQSNRIWAERDKANKKSKCIIKSIGWRNCKILSISKDKKY